VCGGRDVDGVDEVGKGLESCSAGRPCALFGSPKGKSQESPEASQSSAVLGGLANR